MRSTPTRRNSAKPAGAVRSVGANAGVRRTRPTPSWPGSAKVGSGPRRSSPPGALEDLIAAVQRFERTARDDAGPFAALGQTAALALKERLVDDLSNAVRHLPAVRVATAATAAAALAEFLKADDEADAAEDPAVQKAAKRKATAAFRRFEGIRTGALVPDDPPAEWPDDVFDLVMAKADGAKG